MIPINSIYEKNSKIRKAVKVAVLAPSVNRVKNCSTAYVTSSRKATRQSEAWKLVLQ
jgi:hypothetical protein